jgi:hypothetical protein
LASASHEFSEPTKPSRLTSEEFFSEAWKTAQPANRTETRSRSRKKRRSEADSRQRSIFPSEDEQREQITWNEERVAEIPAYPETIGQSPILRAFYDAFGQDGKLSRDLREAIQNAVQPGFRENIVKQRRIKAAIFNVLQTHAIETPTEGTERAFGIFLEESENLTPAPVSEKAAPEAISGAAEREGRQDFSLEKTLEAMKQRRDEDERTALAQGMVPIGDARLSEAISRLERQIERERESEKSAIRDETPSHEADDATNQAASRPSPEPVTLVGTELGPDGRTIEITLPAEAEIIARHESERQAVRENAASVFLTAAMKSIENVSADETRSPMDRAESISGNVRDLRERGFNLSG